MSQKSKKSGRGKKPKITLAAIYSKLNSFVGRVIDKIESTEAVLRKEMNERFDEVISEEVIY